MISGGKARILCNFPRWTWFEDVLGAGCKPESSAQAKLEEKLQEHHASLNQRMDFLEKAQSFQTYSEVCRLRRCKLSAGGSGQAMGDSFEKHAKALVLPTPTIPKACTQARVISAGVGGDRGKGRSCAGPLRAPRTSLVSTVFNLEARQGL